MATHRILGIDPGTRITGYGIIDCDGSKINPIDYGCIRPPADQKLSDRYLSLFRGMEEVLIKHQPDIVVVETQFMNKNPDSALKLGMARGVLMLAAKLKEIPIYEYAPRKAKQAVVGNGNASKKQVGEMVRLLLKLKTVPTPEDAADALALAICHAQGLRFQQLIASEV